MGSLERNSFSFIEFYSRRIKRIFPALLLVLTASFVFGWFALLADEYKQLGKHIAGGAGFISNFLFWNESGYFDNAAETKPLLHLWSLGIEEQFYIVWPLLLWAAWRKRFNLLTITILVAVISFALNISKVHGDAIAAFYSPQTRFWELLVGSILAYMTLYRRSLFPKFKHKLDMWLGQIIYAQAPEANGKTLHNIQSLIGAFLILAGLLIITKERHFPGWWAILPTVGALLIISAGVHSWFNRVVLSNRVLVWFGLISFPLYLWHWPLLSFIRIMEGDAPSRQIRIFAVLISIALAWLTYRLIEKPIRFGNHSKAKTIILFFLMIVVGCVGYNCFEKDGFKLRHKKQEDSLAQFSWPENMNHNPDCINKYGSKLSQYCLVDDTKKQPEIMLIGDSIANHLYDGLNKATKGKNLLMLGQGACLPFLGVSTLIAEGEMNCQNVMADALNLAASSNSVKTVVLSMMGAGYINNKRGVKGGLLELHSLEDLNQKDPIIIFESSMRKTLHLLKDANKEVIFVVSTPRLDFNPATCVDIRPLHITTKILENPCGIKREVFDADNEAYRNLVFKVLKDYPNVHVFDTANELCDDHYCWAMKNGEMLYRDDVHLSLYGSDFIAQKLVKLISTSTQEH